MRLLEKLNEQRKPSWEDIVENHRSCTESTQQYAVKPLLSSVPREIKAADGVD
jgi:hypothetical protein